MEITLEQFKLYIPDVTLEDVVIQRYLADSKRAVIRDGFDMSHIDFDELQRLYCLGLLQQDKVAGVLSATSSGDAPEGIRSIGVAGINIGFADSSTANRIDRFSNKIGYMADYSELVRKLRGLQGRIV
jgi:hypothetical protein